MKFLENRLQGIRIDQTGREASLSIIDASGAEFALELHGVERLLVTDLRQQNVIEDMTHWAGGERSDKLQEAAFLLMTGVAEDSLESELSTVANGLVERVVRGEIEVMSMTAIFGAQVLASFASMIIRRVTVA